MELRSGRRVAPACANWVSSTERGPLVRIAHGPFTYCFTESTIKEFEMQTQHINPFNGLALPAAFYVQTNTKRPKKDPLKRFQDLCSLEDKNGADSFSSETLDFLNMYIRGDYMYERHAYPPISSQIRKELMRLRPCESDLTVYRGLHFSIANLLHPRGSLLLRFLRAPLGHDVTYKSNRFSSWTSSLETATLFSDERNGFGIVLQLTIPRKAILFDSHMLSPQLKNMLYARVWYQDEVVLLPGRYRSRIISFNSNMDIAKQPRNKSAYQKFGRWIAQLSRRDKQTLESHLDSSVTSEWLEFSSTNGRLSLNAKLTWIQLVNRSPSNKRRITNDVTLEPYEERNLKFDDPNDTVRWIRKHFFSALA